jgi:hypothetical protein
MIEKLYERTPFPLTADGVALELDKPARLWSLGGEFIHEHKEIPYYDQQWLIRSGDGNMVVSGLYSSESSAWRALAIRMYGSLEELICGIKTALMKAKKAEERGA